MPFRGLTHYDPYEYCIRWIESEVSVCLMEPKSIETESKFNQYYSKSIESTYMTLKNVPKRRAPNVLSRDCIVGVSGGSGWMLELLVASSSIL